MWQRVIDTNLKGPFICMREVYEFISRGGKVVNIGSVFGYNRGPRTISYACAKAGVFRHIALQGMLDQEKTYR